MLMFPSVVRAADSIPEVPASARPDLYISADIESDGPIPGEFSMLSFALRVAALYDGSRLTRLEDEDRSFYAELKPISEQFQPEALEVNGLQRDDLLATGREPTDAMSAAAQWVEEQADGARPVLVAYPVAFDWSFLYWYFMRFTGRSPFGFSSCLDIRTLYQARAKTVCDRSTQRCMPSWLLPSHPHTHHAADDALAHAQLFNNIFAWALADGGPDDLDTSTGNGNGNGNGKLSQPPTPKWLLSLTEPDSPQERAPYSPSWASSLAYGRATKDSR